MTGGNAMHRRSFLTLLGGASAAAWPLAARAQQAVPVVGYLRAAQNQTGLAAFRRGLNEQGYVEGRNLVIELREAERNERLPALVAEFVRRPVAVIFTAANTGAALAAKAATATIPIVFTIGSDPVQMGLVASLNRPGGNVTGVTFFTAELGPKRLELLRELAPQANPVAFLVDPTSPTTNSDITTMQAAARTVGQEIVVLRASTASEIDSAFATL